MSVQLTTKWALRFYQGTDTPDGATQQANLAADVERSLTQSGTLAARASITGTALRAGLFYLATDQVPAALSVYDGTNWLDIAAAGLRIGDSIETAAAGDPSDSRLLLEDGRALARAGQYAQLFTIIGTTFGAGDGSTTFNIPDSRGRVSVGPDNMGTVQGAANRIPNTLRALGQVHGEERHSMTLAENGPHNHTYSDPGHNHAGASGVNNILSDSGTTTGSGFDNGTRQIAQAATTANRTVGITLFDSGSGTGHNTMQPGVVKNKLIRVK